MTDTSTHDTYTQNIQNNAVISVTTLDPTIAAEAMRMTGELSAQLAATQIAAHQTQQQLQNAAAGFQQESQNKDVQLQGITAGFQQEFQQHTAATGKITQEREGAFITTIMELQAAGAKMQARLEQSQQQQAYMQTMYDQQTQQQADWQNRCEQQQQQQVNMQAMYEQKITQLQLAGHQPQQAQGPEKPSGLKPETYVVA